MEFASVVLVGTKQENGRILIFRRSFTMPGESEIFHVDAYVIVSEHYAIICDTLLCPQDMEQLCEQITDHLRGKQLFVINSHADWDHSWGNKYFSVDTNISVRNEKGEKIKQAILIAQEHCRERLLATQTRELLQRYKTLDETFRQVEIVAPAITFSQMLTLHCDDLTIELFAAPGHSVDHCALWIPQWRILFAFDAIEMPIPLLEDQDVAGLMEETLQYFLDLQPQHVYSSHNSRSSVQDIQWNLAYVRHLKERCHAYLQVEGQRIPGTDQEWERVAQMIYPWTNESQFYREAHRNNVRMMICWLSAFGGEEKESEY